jgi:hypothetical protein
MLYYHIDSGLSRPTEENNPIFSDRLLMLDLLGFEVVVWYLRERRFRYFDLGARGAEGLF